MKNGIRRTQGTPSSTPTLNCHAEVTRVPHVSIEFGQNLTNTEERAEHWAIIPDDDLCVIDGDQNLHRAWEG